MLTGYWVIVKIERRLTMSYMLVLKMSTNFFIFFSSKGRTSDEPICRAEIEMQT